MIYTIKNESLTVKIKDSGAELESILGSDGTEYLWQGDPAFWKGKAYNLFPIVGRLPGGNYAYKGKTYEMNLHGFVRNSVLKAENIKDNSVEFVLTESPETLKCYPFNFEYRIKYAISGSRLDITVKVKNTGGEDLIFAVGGHPGFNVPIGGEGEFDDYYLEFDGESTPQKFILSPACLTTEQTVPFPLEDGNRLSLKHGLFDDDAICLKDMAKSVVLKSDKAKRAVRVFYPDMSYLGIWHAPKKPAPYVCIEPWSSMPSLDGIEENLETKFHMEKLPLNGEYTNIYGIEISEG